MSRGDALYQSYKNYPTAAIKVVGGLLLNDYNDRNTKPQTDFATYRLNWPAGQLREHMFQLSKVKNNSEV